MNENTEKQLEKVLDEASCSYSDIMNTVELTGRFVTLKLQSDVCVVLNNFLKDITKKHPSYVFTTYVEHAFRDFISVTLWLKDKKAIEIEPFTEFKFYSLEAEWRVKTDTTLMQILNEVQELIHALKYKFDAAIEPYEIITREY